MAYNELVGRGWSFPVGVDTAGGLSLSENLRDIEEAIRIVVGTSPGERVMRPDFGCRIHELVFAPTTNETLGTARHYVDEALQWWEPRIEIEEVQASFDPLNEARILIEVQYTVRTTKDARSLVFPFYLIGEEPAA
jgi:hypothetical protein